MKDRAKIVKFIGNIITVLALLLIIRKLISYELDYTMLMNRRTLLVLGICLAAYVINVISGALPWMKMVEIVSQKKMPYMTTTFVHVRANLLKYLPGNVFQYIGKNELATKEDVGHMQVAAATVLDILLMFTIAAIIGGLCVRQYLLTIIRTYVSLKYIVLLSLVAAIFLFAVCMYLKKKKGNLLQYGMEVFKNKRNIKNFVICTLYYVIQNIWVGGIYVALLLCISEVSAKSLPTLLIIGANIISGVIGFITPGVPGGLGVREIVMALITRDIFIEDDIMLTSVIFRIISIIGDLAAFLLVAFIVKIKKSHLKPSSVGENAIYEKNGPYGLGRLLILCCEKGWHVEPV